ncbi:MAG: glycosyltransferase family 4 protein, partial [Bifidobacteriaceae bacterium]|nr:glycosyltransferase family 4 protein [Bifidobacteriaceae bacterium]
MGRTLIITNDFPPRQGGIENFVFELARRFAPDEVVVYTSSEPGDTAFDATLAFPVFRARTKVLLPTAGTAHDAELLIGEYGCDSVWFGAAAPLALMARRLRSRTGVKHLVATTHGHELWWARLPAARQALRRIGDGVDHVTYIAEYIRRGIAPAFSPAAQAAMVRLSPGVTPSQFAGQADPAPVIDQFGLHGRPVVLHVARLVERKGQDCLIRALPLIRRDFPEAVALIVGEGPYGKDLRSLAARLFLADAVVFAGGVPNSQIAPYYAAAQVFAMPTRTRRHGLEVEGLGIVYLEAAAAGLPVVVGNSGGAPEAVKDGQTG